jgi:uncharacterized protein (DUF736 family)
VRANLHGELSQQSHDSVLTQGIQIGAVWQKTGETSGKEYVSLSIADPELAEETRRQSDRAASSDEENLLP